MIIGYEAMLSAYRSILLGEREVVYLSHPMTTGGRSVENNIARSEGIAAKLREVHSIVINPCNAGGTGWSHEQWMEFWSEIILTFVTTLCSPWDWETSEGCKIESALAKKNGITVVVLKEELYGNQEGRV